MNTRFLALVTAALMALALPASAEEWAFPAASQPGYSFNTTVSFKVGAMVPDGVNAGFAGGIELAVDDPLIQLPYGKIRDQFSYNRFENGGLIIETLEYNPHYMVPIGEEQRIWVGGGPGVGYMFTDSTSGPSPDLWTAQLGVSASTVIDHLQIGLESRYQWTDGQRVGNTGTADNWLTMLKFGYAY